MYFTEWVKESSYGKLGFVILDSLECSLYECQSGVIKSCFRWTYIPVVADLETALLALLLTYVASAFILVAA